MSGAINTPSSSTVQLQSDSLHCNCSISCAGTHIPYRQRVHLSCLVTLHSWLTVWLTAPSGSLVRGFSVYWINQIINQIAWFHLIWLRILSVCVVPPALFGQFWGWSPPLKASNTFVNLLSSVLHPFLTASASLSLPPCLTGTACSPKSLWYFLTLSSRGTRMEYFPPNPASQLVS